eukprot:16449716-Heterocapsa_arctica.AAC.1
MCKQTAVGAKDIRAMARKPCLGMRGAKPGKRSPEKHATWHEGQINKCAKHHPRGLGNHDIFIYFINDQDGRHICMDCVKNYAERRDLVKNNTCTGAPDRRGHGALQAVANSTPLRRSHIRSDAKLASGMGLEAGDVASLGLTETSSPWESGQPAPEGRPFCRRIWVQLAPYQVTGDVQPGPLCQGDSQPTALPAKIAVLNLKGIHTP